MPVNLVYKPFFLQPQVQGLLGDDFLQLPRLPAKLRDLAAGCCTRRIARQPALSRNSLDQL